MVTLFMVFCNRVCM